MGADDDIAAALPQAPPPAPARREAAIAAAMRRFDGEAPGAPVRASSAASGWLRRPYSGALAAAALVALVAIPLAWTSLDQQPYRQARAPHAAPAPAADAAGPAAAEPATPPDAAAPARRPPSDVVSAPGSAVTPDKGPAPTPTGSSEPASEPAPPARQERLAEPAEPAAPAAAASGEVVVTGSRIRRPNLESSTPVTVVNDSAIVVTGSRVASARAARRGDWNACTVDDPARKLDSCRVPPALAVGLARAWQGDWESSIRAFDSAIAAAPRSSAAWLNRGLAHRRNGDLDRALADLDRAVRFSPRSARNYFQRSLVLRQRGDAESARADEARAVELDPRYAVVVPPQAGR